MTRDRAKAGRNWYDYCGNDPLREVDPSGEIDIPTMVRVASITWWGWYNLHVLPIWVQVELKPLLPGYIVYVDMPEPTGDDAPGLEKPKLGEEVEQQIDESQTETTITVDQNATSLEETILEDEGL